MENKSKISVIGLRGFPAVEGGVEKHCEALYPRLADRYSITVYRRRIYAKDGSRYKDICFVDLPSTKIKGVEAFVHSFLASVHALFKKPDLIHYHNIGPALFSPIVKLGKIPVVLTYHSANYEHSKWGTFAKKLLLFSEKVALNTADRIIFVNRFQMEKFPEDIQKKSFYVPNGIGDIPFSNNTDYLSKIGVEPGKYILSVGRITEEKGFDVLIKAFKHANLEDIKLVIAGDVEFEAGYKQKLENLSKGEPVIFTGFVHGEKLSQLYSHAGLYVLASNNEGFPLVLLEAMKFGLGVIVSDIPATHLVDIDEADYFSKGDIHELAEKLRMKKIGMDRISYDVSQFDWQEVSNTVSGIYDNLLKAEEKL